MSVMPPDGQNMIVNLLAAIEKTDLNSMNSPKQTSCLPKQPFMSDDHSKVVPLLPIPNRTVKRFCADDSAGSRVKVGQRQTLTASISPTQVTLGGAFVFLQHRSA